MYKHSKFCFLSSFASHQPPFPSCSVIPPLYLVLPTPPLHYLSPNPPYYLTLTFFLCLFLLVLMRIWTPNLWICSPLHYPLDHTSNRWNSSYNSQPYNLLVPDSPWPNIIFIHTCAWQTNMYRWTLVGSVLEKHREFSPNGGENG